jgi:phospholipase/carboxylesterase
LSGPVLHAGAELKDAAGVVILLHGRGASTQDILSLSNALSADPQLAWLAPQAEGSSWYPYSFLAPREENEPKLSQALWTVQGLVETAEAAGITRERILIGGFSQGACLTTEFVATHPARYAGVLAFTGGLIGPLGSDVSKVGLLQGTPALLSSGDPDPHVPWSRVEETAAVLTEMGAQVTLRRYPGRPHTIGPEELELGRALVRAAFPKA